MLTLEYLFINYLFYEGEVSYDSLGILASKAKYRL